MTNGRFSLLSLASTAGVLVLLGALSSPIAALADEPAPDQGNCIACHENLYFLHDTGNWYCLREAPMSCVDCHGGDPLALTTEQAHLQRAAHPVVNEDISKCQECHPAECDQRLALFDRAAGINQVLIAAPYRPAQTVEATESTSAASQPHQPGGLLGLREMIPPALVAGLALLAYLVRRRATKNSSDGSMK